MNIPTLNREQIREVDRRAVEEYGMSSLVLMENAGRGCTDKLFELGIGGPVVVCCGKGNNSGDGFVVARHLDLRGVAVKVMLWSDPAELAHDAAANYGILIKSDVPVVSFGKSHDPAMLDEQLSGADWIIDALLGTGARGEPRPPLDAVIDQLNSHAAKKLAIDLPSGLDCDTGQTARHTFRADHTCTFVAAKPGFLVTESRPYVGQIHVLDIGAPRKLVEEMLRAANARTLDD
jgi:NAD(P)H-hydrate epimerase